MPSSVSPLRPVAEGVPAQAPPHSSATRPDTPPPPQKPVREGSRGQGWAGLSGVNSQRQSQQSAPAPSWSRWEFALGWVRTFYFFWSSFQWRLPECPSERSGCVQTHLQEHAQPGGRKSWLCKGGRTASSPKPLEKKNLKALSKHTFRIFFLFFFLLFVCSLMREIGSSPYTGEVERDGGCSSGRECGNGLGSNFISIPWPYFCRVFLKL